MPSIAKRRLTVSTEPPLDRDFRVVALENDAVLFHSIIKRGLLSLEFAERSDRPLACNSDSAKTRLRLFAAHMRALLHKAGHPTDHDYVWIKVGEADWKPDNHSVEIADGQPCELRSWHDQLVATTDPLSDARIQGDTLDGLDQVLRRGLGEDVLGLILQLMTAFGQFRVSGRINKLAVRGAKHERNLSQGGKARARSGAKKLALVCDHAEKFWREKAAMRGNKTGSAEFIASRLNEEIRAIGEKPLRPKRIADLISKGISGGLLHIG
jgi:hypothetical protein